MRNIFIPILLSALLVSCGITMEDVKKQISPEIARNSEDIKEIKKAQANGLVRVNDDILNLQEGGSVIEASDKGSVHPQALTPMTRRTKSP